MGTFALLLLSLLAVCLEGKKFLHQRPDQHKSYPGWQEPGLWRPRWVLDREFDATETSKAHKDRLYLKLKPDRTVSIYSARKRPWLQWLKSGTKSTGPDTSKKNLFEANTAGTEPSIDDSIQEDLYSAEGTWSFADEAPMPTGRVIIETKERSADGSVMRIRHECRCDWGRLDDYAARFRRGRLFKYKGVQRGSDVPIGKYAAGTFRLRANVQRPLVSKEFLAFQ